MMPSKLLIAAALAAGILAAPAAHAFTFENGTGTNANANDASAMRFGTGDSRFSTSTGTGTTSGPPGRSTFGNGSLQFNSQSSFDQRYNSNSMFESNSILGKDR